MCMQVLGTLKSEQTLLDRILNKDVNSKCASGKRVNEISKLIVYSKGCYESGGTLLYWGMWGWITQRREREREIYFLRGHQTLIFSEHHDHWYAHIHEKCKGEPDIACPMDFLSASLHVLTLEL